MRTFAIMFTFFFTALNGLQAQEPEVIIEIDPPFCGADCYTMTAIVTNGGPGTGPYQYYWNNGYSGPIIFDICQPSIYSVTVVDVNGLEGFASLDLGAGFFYPHVIEPVDACPDSISLDLGDSLIYECMRVCVGSTSEYLSSINSGYLDEFLNIYNIEGGNPLPYNLTQGGFSVSWEETGSYLINYFDPFDSSFCNTNINLCVSVMDPPEAAISSLPAANNGTLTICEGQAVYFTYSGTNADELLWEFGDGGISTKATLQYTYTQAGTYQLMLTASSGCECDDTVILDVIVEAAETPLVDCVGTLCEGMLGTYTTDASCGTYLWSVSSNGIIVDGGGTSDDYISVQWLEGPEGTVELLTENCSGSSCPVPATIKVPIISDLLVIDGPDKVCRGDQAIYSIPAYEGASIQWTISGGAQITSGQGTNELEVLWSNLASLTQPYTVSVTIDNCYLDCSASSSLSVNVKSAFNISGNIEVCANSTEIYNSIDLGQGTSFNALWTLYNPQGVDIWQSGSATSAPAITFPNEAGVYRLVATPSNPDDFCQEESIKFIYVLPIPPAVDAIDGNTTICPGEVQAYEAISSEDNVYFEWLVVNGGTSTTLQGNPINVTWGNTPPYEISVVQINTQGEHCISSATMLNASAFGNLSLQGPADGCVDDISTYSTTFAENITYEWEIIPNEAGTIVSEPDESTIDIIWHQAGNVTVNVTACNESASTTTTVHPLPEPQVIHPDFLCPNETATVQTTTLYSSYEWRDENNNLVSTAVGPDLPPGRYLVIVTDDLGCTGQETFHIQNYPVSQVYISTPDPWLFCNEAPFTRLYAEDTEEGYQYQWYQDGVAVGANQSDFTATAYGDYYVEIVDIYGCTYTSNTITIEEDCNFGQCGGKTGPSADCEIFDFDYTISTGSVCEERVYQNISTGYVPGSTIWQVFNQDAIVIASSTDENPVFTLDIPAYYRVRLILTFPDPLNPGETVACEYYKVDSVRMVADFEATTVCGGETTEFEDITTHLPITSITSWQWNFGDPASGANNTSNLQHPTHTFSAAGTYTVELVVTDASGCISRNTQQVDVIAPPSIDFADPEASCANTASMFIADAPGAISYSWDFGDPASGDANTMQVGEAYHRYDAPGNYTVSLYAENIYGCGQTFTKAITIAPNPLGGDIIANPAPPLCEGDLTTLSAPPGGVSWEWSNGETTETISVGTEDVYEVTVTDVNGCTHEPDAIEVDIIPAPEAYIRSVEYDEYGQPIAYYYDSYETCYGEPIFLESQEDINYIYNWSTGETTTMVEYSEEKFNELNPGAYLITLELSDINSGCTAIMGPFEVIVHSLPQQPVITSTQPQPICEGGTSTLSVSNPQTGVTYRWSTGETGTSITTEEAGMYTVTAINQFGCEEESEVFEILSGPPIHLIPNGCYTRCNPDTICLPDLPGVAGYQWFFNNNPVSPPDGTMPELIINQEGSYYLELLYFNGCVLQTDPLNITLFDGFGSLVGQTFMDVNDNGIIDGPDTLINDIGIQLWQNGSQQQSTQSVQGGYSFIDIPSNLDYELVLDSLNLDPMYKAVWTNVDTNLVGCEQIITINWLIRPDCTPTASTVMLEACQGESADYNGTPVMAGTSMDFTFTNVDGCDSTVTVQVGELLASASTLVFEACEGESIDYGGSSVPAGSSMDFTLTNAAGCDSILTIQVDEILSVEENIHLITCEGEPAFHDGQALVEGLNTFQYTSVAGCDSTLSVILEVELASTTNVVLSVCPDSTINFHGNLLKAGESASVLLSSQNGCDSTVEASVMPLPLPEAEWLSMPACPDVGGAISINITNPTQAPYTYTLNEDNISTSAAFTDLEGGAYELTIQDANGCSSSYDIMIPAIEPLEVLVQQDSMSCEDMTATLMVNIISGDDGQLNFAWNDGTTALQRAIETPGIYTLALSNSCESITENIEVPAPMLDAASLIYIPTAFSPNGDGVNDLLEAYYGNDTEILNYELAVFDRYGGQIFQSDIPEKGWDGICKGQMMNTGVYVWHLKASVIACGREYNIVSEGDVALLR